MNISDNLLNTIIGGLVVASIIGIFAAISLNPIRECKSIFKRIIRLCTSYQDPHRLINPIQMSVIGKNIDVLKDIVTDLDSFEIEHPFFYKIFRLTKLRIYLDFIFEYTRDPIMLPKAKCDYVQDIDIQKVLKDTIKNCKFILKRGLIL